MSSRTLPKAIEYLSELQSQTSRPPIRLIEDVFASMLSNSEGQWEDIARGAGLVFNEQLRQKVHHLKEIGFLDALQRHKADTPRLQSIIDYSILHQTKESFDELIRLKFSQSETYAVSDKVFFGTLEYETLNAMITPVPNSDDFLIVINRALWDMAKLLPFTIATTLFTEQFTFRSLDRSRDYPTLSLSSEITKAIVTRSRTSPDLPALPPPDHPISLVHTFLYRGIHDFIVGHEYGHFLRGHFEQGEQTETFSIGELSIALNTTAWRNEYEADRVGLDLAVIGARESMSVDASPGDPIAEDAIGRAMSLAWLGCWASLHLLFRMDRYYRTVYTVDSSHPPSGLRIAAMWRTILSQQAPQTVRQAQELLLNAAQCVAVMFEPLSQPGLRKETDHLPR